MKNQILVYISFLFIQFSNADGPSLAYHLTTTRERHRSSPTIDETLIEHFVTRSYRHYKVIVNDYIVTETGFTSTVLFQPVLNFTESGRIIENYSDNSFQFRIIWNNQEERPLDVLSDNENLRLMYSDEIRILAEFMNPDPGERDDQNLYLQFGLETEKYSKDHTTVFYSRDIERVIRGEYFREHTRRNEIYTTRYFFVPNLESLLQYAKERIGDRMMK